MVPVVVRVGCEGLGEPCGVAACDGVELWELAGVGGYVCEVGRGGARLTFDISRCA